MPIRFPGLSCSSVGYVNKLAARHSRDVSKLTSVHSASLIFPRILTKPCRWYRSKTYLQEHTYMYKPAKEVIIWGLAPYGMAFQHRQNSICHPSIHSLILQWGLSTFTHNTRIWDLNMQTFGWNINSKLVSKIRVQHSIIHRKRAISHAKQSIRSDNIHPKHPDIQCEHSMRTFNSNIQCEHTMPTFNENIQCQHSMPKNLPAYPSVQTPFQRLAFRISLYTNTSENHNVCVCLCKRFNDLSAARWWNSVLSQSLSYQDWLKHERSKDLLLSELVWGGGGGGGGGDTSSDLWHLKTLGPHELLLVICVETVEDD